MCGTSSRCYRGVRWHGFEFAGEFLRRDRRRLPRNPLRIACPTVYLSGTSARSDRTGGRHGDVHLLDEQSHGIAAVASELRSVAAGFDREVRIGLELPIVAREDADEAWARVLRQWREVHPDATAADVRALALDGSRWAGFDRIGYRQQIGLVGSYEDVAQALS
ncbi:LLM class flavin-dependent oxidoreductase, partial [Rhodococcus hoagii]|nr:LLM class flavin-dependent oxidoreductase [Prescottella equi]